MKAAYAVILQRLGLRFKRPIMRVERPMGYPLIRLALLEADLAGSACTLAVYLRVAEDTAAFGV